VRRTVVKTLVLGTALLLVGCNARPQQPGTHGYVPELLRQVDADCAQPAAALAFDPPVTANEPPVDLSREGRETTAFVGYQDAVTTYSYTRSDDWFGFVSDSGLLFQRRAVSERVGVSYR
jgi:hypothetical protein